METGPVPGPSRPPRCLLPPRGAAEGPGAQQCLAAVLPAGARPVSAGAISCHLAAEVPALEADSGQRSQRLRKKLSAGGLSVRGDVCSASLRTVAAFRLMPGFCCCKTWVLYIKDNSSTV